MTCLRLAVGAASAPRASTLAEPAGVAIVGCGQIMTHHVAAMAASGAALRVRALCDPSPARRAVIRELVAASGLADAPAAALAEFDGLDGLLSDARASARVRRRAVAVPHDAHEGALALEAMRAGKHVVLEKPLAPTLAACRAPRARRARRARGDADGDGMLVVAEQSPHWQEIVRAKELIAAGAIGDVLSAASYYYESMRDNVTSGVDADGGLGWRCSLARAGGGIVIDGGLHWLRPLRELLGDPEAVVAVTRAHVQPGLRMEGETLAHALLRVRAGGADRPFTAQPQGAGPLVATYSAHMLHTAPMAHDACPYFRVTGSAGELVVAGDGLDPDGGGGLRLYDDAHPSGVELFSRAQRSGRLLPRLPRALGRGRAHPRRA